MVNSSANHYDVLGVDAAASPEAIKAAYYAKARRYHPDAHARSSTRVREEAEREMQALNAAWVTLRSPRSRAAYDRALRRASRTAPRRGHPLDDDDREPIAALTIGRGFRMFMASMGVTRGAEGTQLSLALDGATDLRPLRSLAPAGLQALHAAGAAIGDRQLRHLRGMHTLRTLDLSETQVSDVGLLHLQDLDGLEDLRLWGTAVGDGGCAVLGRLAGLRCLSLGDTLVTDEGLAMLAPLASLRILHLAGTQVEGPGLTALEGMRDLQLVSLPWRVRGRWRRALRAALPGATIT